MATMATTVPMPRQTHFQLFSSSGPAMSVPTIAIPNPRSKRAPNLHYAFSSPIDNLVKSPNGESVIIQIVEEPMHSKPLPSKPASVSASADERASGNSCIDASRKTVPAPLIDARTPSPGVAAVASAAEAVHSKVEAESKATAASPVSPGVPMRSMFPIYNPSVPLNQQSYYPQRPYYPKRSSSLNSAPSPPVSRMEYSVRVGTPSRMDHQVGGLKTAPASLLDFPFDTPALSQPKFSTYKELEKLWDATNGQDPDSVVGSFDLEMCRVNEATFTFGADGMSPFYTLQTYDTNEISLARTNPQKRATSVEIILLALQPRAGRLPPQDWLISCIFPRLAALLAIDQAAELARLHDLAPTHRDEMQTAAVQRAADQESCKLYWRENEQRYELSHPAIGRNSRDPDFATSPLSPLGDAGVVHITVSAARGGGNVSPASTILSGSASGPMVVVTNPHAALLQSHGGASMRMSTVPQSDQDEALAWLDLGGMRLHVDAAQILRLMPSLYAIDCIVSALLAVAVGHESTNDAMATMELWSSNSHSRHQQRQLRRPATAPAPGSVFGGTGSVKSYTGSTYYHTLADRVEAEQEATLMRQLHTKDVRSKKTLINVPGDSQTPRKAWWFGHRSAAAEDRKQQKRRQKKQKQIVMGEFDLEELGHYQAGDRKGEELPRITRAALATLVWGLQTLVWLLTALAQLLAWLLVNVSRAVTSERF